MELQRFARFIFERKEDTIKVYHGTNTKFVDEIKNNGLVNSNGYYSAGWYMLSTDFESALYHATPSEDKGNAFVFEFAIPRGEERWDGYPYLWHGYERNDTSTWYAPMQSIPNSFIIEVHEVDYESWIKQKDKRF